NMHWLNPAYVIPVVELSCHPGTNAAVLARTKALMEEIGKLPVVCGASPGYIVPRLQALVMNEAARMIEEGAA
ncbi:3-hydroxyacyl-CoA dehydrogenase, partial [Mycobacterium tuberculosis]